MTPRTLAWLLLVLPFVAARAADSDATRISQLAQEFWCDLNLGDMEKLPPLGRPEDASVIPAPVNGQAAGMMKMKDLLGAAAQRGDIKNQIPKVFWFSAPRIAPGGLSAEVIVKPLAAGAKPYFESKAVYNVYLRDAYEAQQSGQPPPDVETIKARILAPGSPEETAIDAKVDGFGKATFPTLVFEKGSGGWKVNLRKFFTK